MSCKDNKVSPTAVVVMKKLLQKLCFEVKTGRKGWQRGSHRSSAFCVGQSQEHPSSAGIAWHGTAACKTRGDKKGLTTSCSVPVSQQPSTVASHRSSGTVYKEHENHYNLLLNLASSVRTTRFQQVLSSVKPPSWAACWQGGEASRAQS